MAKFNLSEHELKHLSEVITQAEKKTSGEIRLMIAKGSSVRGHVFPILSLQLLVIFMSILLWRPDWLQWQIVVAGLIGLCAVAAGLARFKIIQRLLTDKDDLTAQVWHRAELEFNRALMGRTRDRTGVLIFLSLMERQAVVLADVGISSLLPKETWSSVVKMALAGARKGDWSPHLELAIKHCGELLAQHYPIQPGDKNELENHVMLLD